MRNWLQTAPQKVLYLKCRNTQVRGLHTEQFVTVARVLHVSHLWPNLGGPQASGWVLLRAVGPHLAPLVLSRRLAMPEEPFSKVLGLLRLTLR